jgi:predicted transcriptional regulator
MTDDTTLTTLTADITASFVANNSIVASDIATLITSVYGALAALGSVAEPIAPIFQPAISIRKSLANPDKLVSMIDGKPYSSLKRHLATNGLTPAEYRRRYNLPADYPMTAPGYSARRREISIQLGLGRKPKAPVVVATSGSTKRGRKPKETTEK